MVNTLCCTCPDLTKSPAYQCWGWNWSNEESCVQDQPAQVGEATVWCETSDGLPTNCLDQCG
jgi:hypothetical protein